MSFDLLTFPWRGTTKNLVVFRLTSLPVRTGNSSFIPSPPPHSPSAPAPPPVPWFSLRTMDLASHPPLHQEISNVLCLKIPFVIRTLRSFRESVVKFGKFGSSVLCITVCLEDFLTVQRQGNKDNQLIYQK